MGSDPIKITNLPKYMGSDPILAKKGVFPYEYIDSLDKLKETKLPPKERFYSSLKIVTSQTRTTLERKKFGTY
jgi:hypothetical protein